MEQPCRGYHRTHHGSIDSHGRPLPSSPPRRWPEARAGRLDAPVPPCPGWDVADLVWHTGEVLWFWPTWWSTGGTTRRATRSRQRPAGGDDAARLVPRRRRPGPPGPAAARSTRTTPVWSWATDDADGGVGACGAWPRSSPCTGGTPSRRRRPAANPIDAELASDGIDEFLEYFTGRPFDGAPVGGTVHLHCTDVDGEWLVTEDGFTREHAKGDAAVRGPASGPPPGPLAAAARSRASTSSATPAWLTAYAATGQSWTDPCWSSTTSPSATATCSPSTTCPSAVERGTIVGFLGPNGAGKTTTMRAIMRLVALDAGTVAWEGTDVDATDRATVRLHAGRARHVPPHAGAGPPRLLRPPLGDSATAAGQRRPTGWLERLDLADRAGDQIQNLSSGNQQRIQLALALLDEPDLLVLDEPFSGLDPIAVETLQPDPLRAGRAGRRPAAQQPPARPRGRGVQHRRDRRPRPGGPRRRRRRPPGGQPDPLHRRRVRRRPTDWRPTAQRPTVTDDGRRYRHHGRPRHRRRQASSPRPARPAPSSPTASPSPDLSEVFLGAVGRDDHGGRRRDPPGGRPGDPGAAPSQVVLRLHRPPDGRDPGRRR